MNLKKQILFISIANIIALTSGIFNWLNQFVIVGLIFSLTNYLINKNIIIKKKKRLNTLFLILPFFLLYTLMVIYKGLYHVYPISIISIFGAILGLYFCNLKSKLNRRKTAVFYVVFLLLFAYIIMPNWIHYTVYSEKIIKKKFPESLILRKNDSSIVNLKEIENGKVIVLDLWSSTCASCIRFFPEYEKLDLKYSDKDVVFYTVNMPILKRDKNINVKKYVKNYKFKSLYAQNNIWNELAIKQTPTYIIIDKQFNIVYRASSLKRDNWYYFSTFDSLIKKLKNE